MPQATIEVYVKRITSSSLTGYIVRENTAQLQITLKIADGLYSDIINICENTNNLKVIVAEGIIVGLQKSGQVVNTLTLTDFILNIINEYGTIHKGDLYKLIKEKYDISYSTFQRKLKDLVASNTSIRMNYNNVTNR